MQSSELTEQNVLLRDAAGNLKSGFSFSEPLVFIITRNGRVENLLSVGDVRNVMDETAVGKHLGDLLCEWNRGSLLEILRSSDATMNGAHLMIYFAVAPDVPLLMRLFHSRGAYTITCVATKPTEPIRSETPDKPGRAYQLARMGYWELSEQTHKYIISDELYDIYGLEKAAFTSLPREVFLSLVFPPDREKVKAHLLNASKHQQYEYEHRFVKPSGELIYLLQSVEMKRNAEGEIIKIHGFAKDITELRKSQLQSDHVYDRLINTLETIDQGFIAIDGVGEILYWNRKAAVIMGVSKHEAVGKNIWQLYPHLSGQAFQQACNWVLAHRQEKHFENYEETFGIWFENRIYPSDQGLHIYFSDITAQKEKEAEQRLFETRLKAQNQMMVEVLEQMDEGFITVSYGGKILYWNKKAERISGVTRENALGKFIWELYPGIEDTEYFNIFKKLTSNESPIRQEVISSRTKRLIRLQAYQTEKGVSVFFKDVTDYRTTQKENQRLSLIARETINPVLITGEQSVVIWVNHAFELITGYTLAEVAGKSVSEIVCGPDSSMEDISYLQQELAEGRACRMETVFYKKDGSSYWVELSSQPVFNTAGELECYFTIATDVTERKRLQAKLARKQKQQQLKVAIATLKAQEEVRAAVSQELHDNVNQVLTAVKLYCEMCRDGSAGEEILDQSIKLLTMCINEVRNLSRVLSAPSIGNIKLAESLRELINAVGKNANMQFAFDADSIRELVVDADVHLGIYRIFQEHFANIIKHSRASHVQAVIKYSNQMISFEIKDDGVGFEFENSSRGVGITSLMARAEALHGHVIFETAPGKGCTLQGAVFAGLNQSDNNQSELFTTSVLR